MSRTEITKKLDEIIEFSGCQMYIDTPVKRYSSGMTVRLAFAVAAHLEPDILVVDEVLAVGDAEFQKKAIGKMQDISKGEGRTVLFVSHNMAVVKSLCTRAIVLEHGKTVFEGGAIEAVAFYLKKESNFTLEDLLLRKDRIGNGKILLKSISMLNANYEHVNEVISGEELILKLGIQKNQTVDFSKLVVAINFRDIYEKNIISFISDEMNAHFTALFENNHFYLKIPHLYLRGGVYSLRVLISETDTRIENFLDVIENVIDIQVLPGDIWKTGQLNRSELAAILPAKFEFGE
jgi:lipopolysaccharide transport system ATP-binding protein